MIREKGKMKMAKTALKRAASAETAPAKSAKPVVTLTLRQIAAEIAPSQGLSKKQAEAVLNEAVARISKGVVKGQRVRFGALGIFNIKKLPARKGRNPATGEAIKIKARKRVAFRAAKEFTDTL
jgi:DNA-binding protein HU-beta